MLSYAAPLIMFIYHLTAGQSGGLMKTWIMTHRSIWLRNQQESRIIYKLVCVPKGNFWRDRCEWKQRYCTRFWDNTNCLCGLSELFLEWARLNGQLCPKAIVPWWTTPRLKSFLCCTHLPSRLSFHISLRTRYEGCAQIRTYFRDAQQLLYSRTRLQRKRKVFSFPLFSNDRLGVLFGPTFCPSLSKGVI